MTGNLILRRQTPYNKVSIVLSAAATFLFFLISTRAYAGMAFPISSAKKSQHIISAAYDGTNYLVVWEDHRDGKKPYNNSDIYAARVNKQGIVLDSDGIQITDSFEHDSEPAVAFDGENFLVVWVEAKNVVFGTRLDKDGNILDASPLRISTESSAKRAPSLVFSGTNYFVVWTDYRNAKFNYPKADIYGAKISTNGSLLEGRDIPISTSDYDETDPVLAWDGTNYVMVWIRTIFTDKLYRNIVVARVDSRGINMDGSGMVVRQVEFDTTPRIAVGGGNYFVTWDEMHTSTGYDIMGARYDKNLRILDNPVIRISDFNGNQSSPSVAYNGSDFVVAWMDYRNDASQGGENADIYATVFNAVGRVSALDGVAIYGNEKMQSNPVITAGSGMFIGWTDFSDDNGNFTNSDIYGMIISNFK